MPRKPARRRKRTGKKASKTKLPSKNILLGIILLLLVAVGIYSYRQYSESGIEGEGIVICNEEGICEKSTHAHALLNAKVCGQRIDLPKDTGPLAGVHTHKEKNLLHFHERIRVDPATGEPEGLVDALTLRAAFRDILNMRLTDECIGEYCNGDTCPDGRRGELQLRVVKNFCQKTSCPSVEGSEGEQKGEIQDYMWRDGDLLNLTFE